MLSLDAEKLLARLLEDMDDAGRLKCTCENTIAFRELEEAGMFSSCKRYVSGGAYVALSGAAVHYFENKTAAEQASDASAREAKKDKLKDLIKDVLLVVFGAVLSWLFQRLT